MAGAERLDPYAVLQVSPGCTDAQVREAYEKAKRQLGPDSLATYALAEPGAARAMLERLEEAFRLIGSAEGRQSYAAPAPTATSTSSPTPTPTGAAEAPKPVRKTEAELPPDAPVTGEALRRVREARGFSLKDLAARTKIGHWHLDNIEKEKYQELPALVYLRGFLMSLARELKLDPIRVSRSYLEQMAKSKPPDG